MSSDAKRALGQLFALLIGIVAFCASSFAYLLLGLFTGVIASCPAAPEWWSRTYLVLS